MTREDLSRLIERLYPITRSITGDGVRETLAVIQEQIPLEIHEVPSGTKVLDWTVPPEWNVRQAWIRDSAGDTIIDMADSNLHLMGYSTPVQATLTLDELQQHLHSLPDRPDLVPYRTSYYNEDWGFCLTDRQRSSLVEDRYEVFVDSALEAGSLTYGELLVEGDSSDEIIVSAHVCHPSLANDNLSGIAAAVALAMRLASTPGRQMGVRFVFAPGTIGTITWLAQNQHAVDRVRGGFTLVSLGDRSPLTFKRTAGGDSTVDRVAVEVLEAATDDHRVLDFDPFGYDERQYNTPGFRLPVGSFMRSIHGEKPEYHTSGDNLDALDLNRLEEAVDVIARVIEALDETRAYHNLAPFGEPQLGKRGIYDAIGGKSIPDLQLAMLWVLNMSDGRHDLVSIAGRSGLSLETIESAADLLLENDLIG